MARNDYDDMEIYMRMEEIIEIGKDDDDCDHDHDHHHHHHHHHYPQKPPETPDSGTTPDTGASIELDDTLTKEGYAADAKAVGEALKGAVKSVNGVKPDAYGNVTIEVSQEGAPAQNQKLIFTGAVEAEYDGTKEVTINIPEQGAVDVSEIDAEKVLFSEDLLTTVAIGNIKLENGQAVIPAAGKNLKEVWESLFINETYPAIEEPTVAINVSEVLTQEVGSTVSPGYIAVLDPGSYQFGPETGITATAWEITDTQGNTSTEPSGSFPDVIITDDTNYKITANATYDDGAIPHTNIGNAYEAGQIKAGTVSASSGTIRGYRNTFYGTMAEKSTVDSAAIRALSGKSGRALTNGAKFNVTIPVGALRVVIAYPATMRDVSSIKDVNGFNADIAGSFKMEALDVYGANGHEAAPYKVYTLDFAKANDTANTYAVTI